MDILLDGIAASRQLLRGYDGKPGGRHFEDLAAWGWGDTVRIAVGGWKGFFVGVVALPVKCFDSGIWERLLRLAKGPFTRIWSELVGASAGFQG
jgi:hypothetical protein